MNPRVEVQKQHLRRKQAELQSALEQLKNNPVSYSLIGMVLVREEASTIKQRLEKQLSSVEQQLLSLTA